MYRYLSYGRGQWAHNSTYPPTCLAQHAALPEINCRGNVSARYVDTLRTYLPPSDESPADADCLPRLHTDSQKHQPPPGGEPGTVGLVSRPPDFGGPVEISEVLLYICRYAHTARCTLMLDSYVTNGSRVSM